MRQNRHRPACDVLFVSGAGYVSGKEIVTLTLAKCLRDEGRTVHVLSSTWNDGDFLRRLRQADLHHSTLPLGFISSTLVWNAMAMTAEQVGRLPELLWRYGRVLRTHRPHRVVHTNWHHALLLLPFLRSHRDILWVHETFAYSPKYKFVLSQLSQRLDCFVAVSGAVKRGLIECGVARSKVFVIHNGVPELCPVQGRVNSRDSELRMGIAGQVGEWKGHDDIVDALSLLLAAGHKVVLKIFGKDSGQYATSLKARIAALGLADNVVWAGFNEDREAIYNSMDICVAPSRSEEPLSTTAIEASSCGIPVVATTCGGFPEIIEDGVTGFLVPPRAPNALARAIERFIEDPQLQRSAGESARIRARTLFSEARFVRDFAGVLFQPRNRLAPAPNLS